MKGNSITALDGWNSTISNDGKTKNEILFGGAHWIAPVFPKQASHLKFLA